MAKYDFIACYLLANRKYGTLYIGSTSDLITRMDQHKSGRGSSFCSRYNIDQLVWFERFDEMIPALNCEKRMKTWPRAWKVNKIEETNPEWEDLSSQISEYGW